MNNQIISAPSDPIAARDGEEGTFSWYKQWNASGRRTFWACFFGWALDAMDVQLFAFAIPSLMALWSLSGAQAGSIATVVLLSSSVGGWIGGIMCDRIGRVRTLQLSVAWFSVFTFAAAFTNSYEQLLVVRALHGLGFGAEWAAGAVLVAEIIPDRYRGRAGGSVHSGWAVGWGMAALLYGACYSLFSPDMAWRVLFALGAVPAVFVIFIRRFVEESPLYFENQKRIKATGKRPSFWQIYSPSLLRRTILGALLAMGIQGGGYAVAIWLPTFLRVTREVSVVNTSAYVFLFTVAAFFGYVCGGYSSDSLGRRMTFAVYSVVTALMVLVYVLAPVSTTVILILNIPLGFAYGATYSGLGPLLNELYPTAVRGSGIGFCFNFGRAIGSVFPTIIGMLSASMALGTAITILSAGAYALVVVAALLLPETKGKALEL